MDDEMRAYLESMEARLMARMNDNQEKLLDRMRINETATAALTTAVAALTEVARGTNNALASIAAQSTTIASGHADLARRMTDLEKR